MKPKVNNASAHLNRRKFLGLAGVAATVGLTAGPVWAAGNSAIPTPNPHPAETPETNETVPVAKENAIATIIESKIICKEQGRHLGSGTEIGVDRNGHLSITKRVTEASRYNGWATLAKTNTGELIVAFSGDRDSHVCPWGKTQIIRSSDQGKTWSAPETINNTPLDDRDAGIIQTNKGTLLVSWFTSLAFESPVYPTAYELYARHSEKLADADREKWLGNWTRRSEDGGKTWGEPNRTVSTAPHGPIQLRDGRQLYIGNGKWKDKHAYIVEESRDDGRTWKVIATIAQPAGFAANLGEPHLVELASGKILGMFRNEPKNRTKCFLLQCESMDGGKTWTSLHDTGIWGYPPHLIQLKNGWVLVSYGYRRAPFGERACISRDEGKTWDLENEVILNGAPGGDLGYPSSVQLNDGSILTVYYQAEKMFEPSCLHSTHWQLKS